MHHHLWQLSHSMVPPWALQPFELKLRFESMSRFHLMTLATMPSEGYYTNQWIVLNQAFMVETQFILDDMVCNSMHKKLISQLKTMPFKFTHIATSISLDKTFGSFFLEFNSQSPFSLVDIVSFPYPFHPSMDHLFTQLDLPTHFSWMDLCAFIPSTLLEGFQALTFTFQSWCPYQHSVKLVLSCNKTFGLKSLGKNEQ